MIDMKSREIELEPGKTRNCSWQNKTHLTLQCVPSEQLYSNDPSQSESSYIFPKFSSNSMIYRDPLKGVSKGKWIIAFVQPTSSDIIKLREYVKTNSSLISYDYFPTLKIVWSVFRIFYRRKTDNFTRSIDCIFHTAYSEVFVSSLLARLES